MNFEGSNVQYVTFQKTQLTFEHCPHKKVGVIWFYRLINTDLFLPQCVWLQRNGLCSDVLNISPWLHVRMKERADRGKQLVRDSSFVWFNIVLLLCLEAIH